MGKIPPSLRVLYPFDGDYHSSADGRLHYLDEGDGPAVVFLHGNPTWSFLWRDLILGLRHERRCLAIDHLGCGLSDKPKAGPYTLAAHIDRTVAWLKAVQSGPFHLVVHDWGGAIGMGVAGQLADQVQSITLMNTAAFPFNRIPLRISVCRWPVIGKWLVLQHNAFVRAAAYMTTSKALSPAVREGYGLPYSSPAKRIAVYRFVEDIPMRPSHPSWSVLEEVEAVIPSWRGRPVQLIWGLRDWCFNGAVLEEWKRRLPEANVHAYPEAGHFVHEDLPTEEVLELIRAHTNR